MDHTLHTSFDPKSPFSPRARQTIGSKRTLASPVFRKSLRPNTSSRVSASVQIITKTAHNFVERYGQALPVLVTEALTFVERNTVVTARIADNGYAWLICGRRLLVWQYQHLMMLSNVNTPQKKQITQCYELQLPQSDLAHRAELVCVFLNKGSNMPSCLAVSPEGVVRYWPAIAHESLSVEQSVDLQGQECDSLTDVKGLGCILATTTCTVVLVQPQYHAGKYSLNTKMLKPPSGWLGGISKRMSSLIFGPISSESSAETRLVRVLTDQESEDTWIVYVLAGHSLQKWKLSSNNTEQLIFVAELNRLVKESFFPSTICDQNETDVWLLDIQADKGNLIILAAAMNVHVSPKLFYAMVSIETSTNQPPTSVKDFLLLENAALNRDDGPVERLSYRLLLVGLNAYVYNHKIVVVIKPQEATDTLDFSVMSQDFILAGAICMNTPIFFTRTHGLVSIQNVDKLEQSFATLPHQDASFNESSFQATENLTIYNLDPEDIHNAYKDTVGQFKAAFIHHIKQQEAACRDILERLFALNESKSTSRFGVDPVLDKVVLRTLEDLLDDIPAGDPRWTGDAPIGIGSSYSMQVANQLVDKQRAANLLVKFLHETELWDRLLVCTHRDTPIATVHIIAELLEKAVTATKMKRLTANSPVLEAAIERCIKNAKAELKNGLSHQDLFFKEVTGVHRALQEIVNECDEMAHSEQDPNETVAVISEANDVILEVMKEVIDYREQIAPNFVPSAQARSLSPEYLPWTSAPTSDGLYNFLTTQQLLTYNYGIKISSDKSLVNTLFNQLVGLIDIILDGAKNHLESMRGTDKEPLLLKQFEVQRSKFIKPLLLEEKWERAAALAEKYLDFEALVTICELTGNQPRLDEYADRFQAEGFAEFIYNWYLQQNKYGELISQCRAIRKTRTAQKLSGFFASHPSLSWIQNVFEGRYNGAAKTLRNLAANEQESVMRRKTMLSLAKLAKLASDTHDVEHFVRGVNSQLELIVFQEEIPDYVLERFGYDIRRPRVIPPRDLVKLYISSEYKEASELEFKKALDLLAFIEDEELKEELLFDIWRSSILRDSWNYPVVDSPMDTLQHTLFFKLLDLALVLDVQCQISLPPLEALLEDESMESLRSNHNFIVLLKTAYEYAQRTQT